MMVMMMMMLVDVYVYHRDISASLKKRKELQEGSEGDQEAKRQEAKRKVSESRARGVVLCR